MINKVSYYTLWCDRCDSQFEYYVHDRKMDMDEWGWQNEFVNKKELIRLARGEGWHFFKSGKVLCSGCYAKRKLHNSKGNENEYRNRSQESVSKATG